MDTLDDLVVEHLSERLFTRERLTEILASLTANRVEKSVEVDGRIIALQREASDAGEKLQQLYRMVEEGVAEMNDRLRDRIATLRLAREQAQAAPDRIRAQNMPTNQIPSELVEQFGRIMRENIATGDIPFRKAYLRSVIERVEVADHAIRIVGDKATLEQVVAGSSNGGAGVRGSVRKWCTRQDSSR